jgi:hypothetical protein
MTNSCELAINELDAVAGGAGSLGDVATYLKALRRGTWDRRSPERLHCAR